MSEKCKCEVREKEKMTPRFLVWVPGEMVVSPRENGKEKGGLLCRGMCSAECEVLV